MEIDIRRVIHNLTQRGECKCGRCIGVGKDPDPEGHTADMVFFKVALNPDNDIPSIDMFKKWSNEFEGNIKVNPFDGNEHGFMELGAWLGDQENALRYMAFGHLIGAFDLLTPRTVLPAGLPEPLHPSS